MDSGSRRDTGNPGKSVGNLIPGKSANFCEMPKKNGKFLGNRQISGENRQISGMSGKHWEISGKFLGEIGNFLRKIDKIPGNRQISGKRLKVPGNSFPGSDLPGYGK
jgi:hypothetical protein